MIVFLGSVYPDRLLCELMKRNQYVDHPANVFQNSFLKGLDYNFMDIKVIASPVIRSSYNAVKDICGHIEFSHKNTGEMKDIYVGTLPIKGLQLFAEFYKVFRQMEKEFRGARKNNKLIIYALHTPFLLSALLLRKRIDRSCVIVPDLPEYMMENGNYIRRICKRLDRVVINYCLKRIDGFVLLSPYMRDKLPISNKPWVLVEGIYDMSDKPCIANKCLDRVIFYGGSLSCRYGIIELLNAFQLIDKKNYRLWICGDGDGKEYVEKMAAHDERVKYLGVLSYSEVLRCQQQATVLVNPRSSKGEYTKYSFPSKTMEYLASGTPTIMCHLPAIPKEYNEYLYFFDDESPEGMKKALVEICEKKQQELDEFGQKASCFIRTQKNAFVQVQKVIDLMRHEECDM